MDETACFIVNSRGILKSCDVRNPNPSSSSDYLDPTVYNNIKDGQSVYLSTEAIPHFFHQYFPEMNARIVIVTGDSDLPFPIEATSLLEDPRILHWYAQNCTVIHPKLTHLPIGLDYHTVASIKEEWEEGDDILSPRMTPIEQEKQLNQIVAASEFIRSKRDNRAYGNFLVNIDRGNRRDAVNQLDTRAVVYEEEFIPRVDTWKQMAKYAFVISPFGNGLDCHRTWEALALGCIPVVIQSELDPVYGDLPVLRLNSWADFTYNRAQTLLKSIENIEIDWSRLTLAYWTSKIKGSCKIE